jgi:hypothetical protein
MLARGARKRPDSFSGEAGTLIKVAGNVWAPMKKNISSAGLVSSSPVGGDAVKNSTVVSKFSAILAFYFRVSANRCSVRVPGGNGLRLWPCELRLA